MVGDLWPSGSGSTLVIPFNMSPLIMSRYEYRSTELVTQSQDPVGLMEYESTRGLQLRNVEIGCTVERLTKGFLGSPQGGLSPYPSTRPHNLVAGAENFSETERTSRELRENFV